MSRAVPAVPRWAIYSTFALSLVGLGVSTYLTYTHFEGVKYLACSANGVVDCAAVTTSAQSYFLGVPVAVLGLGHFVVMSLLTSPRGWRSPVRAVHLARLVLAIGAMAFVLWLVAAELLYINRICLWCSAVHAVAFVQLVIMTLVGPAQLGWGRSVAKE